VYPKRKHVYPKSKYVYPKRKPPGAPSSSMPPVAMCSGHAFVGVRCSGRKIRRRSCAAYSPERGPTRTSCSWRYFPRTCKSRNHLWQSRCLVAPHRLGLTHLRNCPWGTVWKCTCAGVQVLARAHGECNLCWRASAFGTPLRAVDADLTISRLAREPPVRRPARLVSVPAQGIFSGIRRRHKLGPAQLNLRRMSWGQVRFWGAPRFRPLFPGSVPSARCRDKGCRRREPAARMDPV